MPEETTGGAVPDSGTATASQLPVEEPGNGAKAASAEKNGKAPTLDFRGLELQLPLKLPGSLALQFTSDPDEMPAMVRGFLRAALGDSQMGALGRKLDEENIGFEDVYDVLNSEILEPLFAAYNLDPGKSQASAES